MSKNDLLLLAIDTSMASPGMAVLKVTKGKATVIDVDHFKTRSAEPYYTRTKAIESWAHLFVRRNMRKSGGDPYDIIVREAFNSRMPRTQYSVFSSWAATDRALGDYRLEVTEKAIPQGTVKKLVGGSGKAEKEEVADGVRRLTNYKEDFATSDESDAIAIGLTWLIENKFIVGLDDKGAKPNG